MVRFGWQLMTTGWPGRPGCGRGWRV